MKMSFAAFGLTAMLLPSAALAQTVPVTFQARVTSAQGADAATFPVGAPITISYGVNTTAVDSDASAGAGVFHGASDNLTVLFPTLNVSAVGTTGLIQTFDNVESSGSVSDQVFVMSGPLSSASSLGGAPILDAEVDYLSEFLPVPADPAMISSDALPVVVPPFAGAFVILRTANGTTFVHFEAGGPLVQIRANGSGAPVTLSGGESLTIDIEFDAPGTGLATANVVIGVVTPSGAIWFGPSGASTTPTTLYSGPLTDFGPTPLFDFPSTAGFPPGSYTFFIVVQDPATGDATADIVRVIVA